MLFQRHFNCEVVTLKLHLKICVDGTLMQFFMSVDMETLEQHLTLKLHGKIDVDSKLIRS